MSSSILPQSIACDESDARHVLATLQSSPHVTSANRWTRGRIVYAVDIGTVPKGDLLCVCEIIKRACARACTSHRPVDLGGER